MVDIEIDGKKVSVPAGSTVMEAASQLGIYIPHFCYHRKLSIAANCRMCLVQVEKAPKPLPACATPVTGGMKVLTHSPQAVQAQKGVMEFLLINHPLDCPICDQGGECQLQDLSVGYGPDASRYAEAKRVVPHKDLGPLVSAEEMARCIHCTRCVRFGQEIAGVMELGMAGRGEHSEILTFMGRTIDSELSGNAIDLCPVGALTSKPFRYAARSWEMSRRRSVSPHCGLGSNLLVQVKQNEVLRVLPRDNEAVNECWLSDKDRFAYEGLNSPDRLTQPMIKREGKWEPADWQTALETVARRLKEVRDRHGADSVGFLAAPHQTLEELYLFQKLARGFGTGNVDHRLRQSDFRLDGKLKGAPWLGMPVAEVSALKAMLVVGSTLRKDHPLLALRMRQAVKAGGKLSLVNPVDDELLTRVAAKMIVAPADMADALGQVLKALCEAKGVAMPEAVRESVAATLPGEAAKTVAATLAGGGPGAVFLGNLAQHHPRYAELHVLAQHVASVAGAAFGVLGEAANSVGGYLAGAIPVTAALAAGKSGANARDMLASQHAAYVLLGAEPELDCHDPSRAMAAMHEADFVVALSAYRHAATDYADVLLPIAPFTETAGTYVSTEGRVQSFSAVVRPLGEARPGWKVLRVLGNLLGLSGFDYETSETVRAEMVPGDGADVSEWLSNEAVGVAVGPLKAEAAPAEGLQRIGEVPIYDADAIVRRAPSLHRTRDGQPPMAWMPGAALDRLGLREGDEVRFVSGRGEAVVAVARDDRLPAGCVRLPAGHPLTAGLGGMFDSVVAVRVAAQARAAG